MVMLLVRKYYMYIQVHWCDEPRQGNLFFHFGGREPHSNKYANNYEKQPFPVFHLPSLIFIFFFLEVGYFPSLQRTSKKVRMEKGEILISLRTLKCKR